MLEKAKGQSWEPSRPSVLVTTECARSWLSCAGALQAASVRWGEGKGGFPTGGNGEMHREEFTDLALAASSSVSIPVPRPPQRQAKWMKVLLTQEWYYPNASWTASRADLFDSHSLPGEKNGGFPAMCPVIGTYIGSSPIFLDLCFSGIGMVQPIGEGNSLGLRRYSTSFCALLGCFAFQASRVIPCL